MVWNVLVLITKRTTGTWVIGLLDTLWKMVEALIYTRLRASLQMHDVLHGFRSRIGTGMAIMELNLAQDLVSIYQSHLFLLFLDLRKAYATVDQEHLLITLEGYGAGTRLCGLLEFLWDLQKVVQIQNGFRGPAFPTTRGTSQGGLLPPMIFNMVVNIFIRTCLGMTVEDQTVAHNGLGENIGRCLGVFYYDDEMMVSRDPECMQHSINVLV